jgi:hypothetical protein
MEPMLIDFSLGYPVWAGVIGILNIIGAVLAALLMIRSNTESNRPARGGAQTCAACGRPPPTHGALTPRSSSDLPPGE